MPAPTPTPTDDTELRKAATNPEPEDERAPNSGAASYSSEASARDHARRDLNLFGSNGLDATETPSDPDAPLSFVPHTAVADTVRPQPLRIRTGRFGELEEHELVRLLDSIEDERARARFRESVYLSIFVWIAVALVVFFGPKYLWHAPRVVLPSEVLRARELTELTAPTLTAPHLRSAPPRVDAHTLEHLRSNEPRVAPTPQPRATTPQPPAPAPTEVRPEPRTEPSQPTPRLAPPTASANLPTAPEPQLKPQPRSTQPIPDAPPPQPTSRPDFSTGSQNAGDQIANAARNATSGGRSSTGFGRRSSDGSAIGVGPAEILSDTQGVNFTPYLNRILREIYDTWIPLIPEEARPPLMKSGVTQIRFTILPDGTIGAMHLDGSTHDDALNKAAWGSITGVGQFPALPSQFHGPNLELRIHYLVNRQTE